MRPLLRRTPRLGLCLLALAGTDCSKTNNVDQSTKNTFAQKIDDKGGFVGDQNGLGVYIPPDALLQEELISLSNAVEGEYPPIPANIPAVGGVYSFEPHGLTFLAPATLRLPLPEGSADGVLRAQPGGQWESLGQVQSPSLGGGQATTATGGSDG